MQEEFAHVRLSRASEGSPKKLLDLSYGSRTPIPPIIRFSFSFPEGNKLLDCSVGLSPFSPSITNDVNVSIATSLHQRLPFSGRVHHLSSPDTLCLTQNIFKITECIHVFVHVKIQMHIHIQIHIRIRSHISISIDMCIYTYMSRTPQHSKWNCVGTNRPQHMHMYGHIVCV